MHKKKSKLRERTQLVFIYSLMIITIVSTLAILVLVIQGYRYNRYDGKIEQGGLVQFDSQPSGATVYADSIQLANKTASKITLTAGEHTITMTRSGYNDWKKTVNVKPGTVLWLNYARLFPTSPNSSTLDEYSTVSSAVTSEDSNWMAFVASPASPSVSLVKLDTDTPKVSQVVIPADEYTAAADEVSQRFSVIAWDKDSQSVLVRHEYDGKQEFLVLNLRGDGTAYNLTTRLGVSARKVEFSEGDSKVLYLLTEANELRRANVSAKTLTGPLAVNVSDFTATGQTVITYETFADTTGKRSVGYVSPGNDVSKQITSFALGNDDVLHARAGVYYGDRYVVIVHGMNTDIMTGSLPSSDSKDVISLKSVAKLTSSTAPMYVGFSPEDHRIVYVQSGSQVITHDLELGMTATITLPANSSEAVSWIDKFHIAATVDHTLTYYDYDGTNGQVVSTKALSLPMAISSDDKYLYYFSSSDDQVVALSRIRMTN